MLESLTFGTRQVVFFNYNEKHMVVQTQANPDIVLYGRIENGKATLEQSRIHLAGTTEVRIIDFPTCLVSAEMYFQRAYEWAKEGEQFETFLNEPSRHLSIMCPLFDRDILWFPYMENAFGFSIGQYRKETMELYMQKVKELIPSVYDKYIDWYELSKGETNGGYNWKKEYV